MEWGKRAYKSARHEELLESKWSGPLASNENADGTLGLDNLLSWWWRRGIFSAEEWLEGGGEKGGEGDGDGEKE